MCSAPAQERHDHRAAAGGAFRFFFGFWGNELGLVYDLFAFLSLCALTMVTLMYFLFHQAYIMPLDTSFLTLAVAAVAFEGLCGIINSLQAMKISNLTILQTVLLLISITAVLASQAAFITKELLPTEAQIEHHHRLA